MIKTSKRNVFLMVIITIILPMVFGAVLYYFVSPTVWFVQKIDSFVGIEAREPIYASSSMFWQLIRNYFFDFLWSFSLFNTVYLLFSNNTHAMVVTLTLGTVMEVLQLLGMAKGTFDVFDIMAELIGALVGVFIIKQLRRVLDNEKNE